MLRKFRPPNRRCLPSSFVFHHFTSLQLFLSTWSSRRQASDEEGGNRFRSPKQDPEGHHFRLHKSKGQHILTNPRVLDSIVRKANVNSTDVVLEIGPGTGNLTVRLLEAAHKVVAIEIDKRMVDVLLNRVVDQDKLTVIQKDALKAEFPPFDIVVANIPYGISSPLLAKLVYGTNHFRSATLLLQKEFARRLLANPGDSEYNRLAVNIKLVADVEFVMDVSKRDFVPPPKVDSSVVIIRPKTVIPDVELHEWWAFTRTCFSKKNKTLGATFKQKKKLKEILLISRTVGTTEQTFEEHNRELGAAFEFGEGDDVDIQEEDGQAVLICEEEMRLFKERVISILKLGGFEDKRPSKLSNDELLHLLALLNGAGIYFQQVRPTDTTKSS